MAQQPPQQGSLDEPHPRPVSRRPLGTFDHAQALTANHHPYNIVTVVRLAGVPDEGALKTAIETVVARHPILRARITPGRKRHLEMADVATLPLELQSVTHGDAWISVAERELEFAFDLTVPPLGRFTLLVNEQCKDEGEAASDLVLTFPHALVDGTAVTQLVREVLLLLSGQELDGAKQTDAIPSACDELFPTRWQRPRRLLSSAGFLARQMGDEISYRLGTRGRHSQPPSGLFRNRILPLALTEEETTRLVRESRRHRVSLVAALEAAMLIAVARHCYQGIDMPHRYCAFPLLRRYLEPSVGDDVVACYITVLRLTARVAGEDDLWELGARINRDLDRSMRRGERFLASVWSHFSMRTIFSQSSHRMSTTALSYTGALSLQKSYGDLVVREVHAFVSNFPVGPQYTAQSRMFRGRLWLDVLYLDSDFSESEARAIASTMTDLLTGESGDVADTTGTSSIGTSLNGTPSNGNPTVAAPSEDSA